MSEVRTTQPETIHPTNIQCGDINQSTIIEEVRAAFNQYEQALMKNDLEALDRFFWADSRVIRFGANENLYGIEAIRAFRQARPTQGLARTLRETHITAFGQNFAIATTEFLRPGQPIGRQTQVWVCFAEGWRIVSAHVSALPSAIAEV